MIPNNSPWIKQLNRTRPVIPLEKDTRADVAIVGGGIAGVVTAFYTLLNTNKSVILIEADKIAHGATGHNAGQLASYFEKPLHKIVAEFGEELAIEAQRSVESAWLLVEQIIKQSNLQTPMYIFTGYAGLSRFDQVIEHLKNQTYRIKHNLMPEPITLAEEWQELNKIPSEFKGLYSVSPQENLLNLLNTKNKNYIGILSSQKGCLNSALFSEELIGYLISSYPDRFSFYEKSPVKSITLEKDTVNLEVLDHLVQAKRIVLCTNGFEYFTIKNNAGSEIDTEFHHNIAGRIGYMTGYVAPADEPPVAISYFPETQNLSKDPSGENYFYLTRRPFEQHSKQAHNLVCTGGPDKVLPNGAEYDKNKTCDIEAKESIQGFLETNYSKYTAQNITHEFCWHGLMGFTPNGIRRIGTEPKNPVLLYNLGCNGVGILPSVYGGFRISKILNEEELEPSIFDPGI